MRLDRPRGEVQNPEEFTVLAHLRGWCHNSAICAVCQAEGRAHTAEQALKQTQRVLELAERDQRTLESIVSG